MRDLIGAFKELAEYARQRKKIWLIPVIIALFLIGFLIATAGSSPVPVFVYPLA